MKRAAALVLGLVILLCGCEKMEGPQNRVTTSDDGVKLVNGVWLSFSELDSMVNGGNTEDELLRFALNCKSLSVTDVFIHTVPFCDSIYPSNYYPMRLGYENLEFDLLKRLVSILHGEKIRVHAWVNPYRVKTSDGDAATLSSESPAHKWLFDGDGQNDRAVCRYGGIYLNPAETCVQRLIISAVKEIAENYEVDGIHLDDYFYPTTDAEFDSESYAAYGKLCEQPLTLSDWRRENVNSLISGCYNAIKHIKKDIDFSISPAASIEKNREQLYADIAAWIKGGYVDVLIPQLYFGFDYPDADYGFNNLLKEWKALLGKSDVKLIVGLASYKVGTDLKPDSKEWSEPELLAKELEICIKDSEVSGWCFFSYSSLFGESALQKSALGHIKSTMRNNHF